MTVDAQVIYQNVFLISVAVIRNTNILNQCRRCGSNKQFYSCLRVVVSLNMLYYGVCMYVYNSQTTQYHLHIVFSFDGNNKKYKFMTVFLKTRTVLLTQKTKTKLTAFLFSIWRKETDRVSVFSRPFFL